MAGNYTTTVRNKLRVLLGTSKGSDIDEGFANLAEDVDTKMASWWEDTFAKRPAAGQPNRFFRATDTGLLYHDTGSVWEQVPTGVSLSWANISGGSVPFVANGSSGMTVSRSSTGIYTVGFPSRSVIPAVTVTPVPENSTQHLVANLESMSTASAVVRMVLANSETLRDPIGLSVIVAGPSI